MKRNPALALALAMVMAALCGVAAAHGFQAGAIAIEHPYALPSAPGARDGSAHLRALRNGGRENDRLVGASTPAAAAVQIERAAGPQPAIDLPPGVAVDVGHRSGWRLALKGLKAPLKAGDRFPLVLRFERAGDKEVPVDVVAPRGEAATRQ